MCDCRQTRPLAEGGYMDMFDFIFILFLIYYSKL